MNDAGRLLQVAACILVLACAPFARAGIFGTVGATQISPPPSVQGNVLESNSTMYVFVERSGIALPAETQVDISQPSTFHELSDLTPASVPAGTLLDSYYVHFDPVGTTTSRTLTAAVTFDQPVLGIQARTATLVPSIPDLGSPSTLYDTVGGPGADYGQDYVTLASDLRTVGMTFTANSGQDEIRVLVAAPEPVTLAPLAMALLLIRRRQRGSRVGIRRG